ncbi:MAG: hypothetical protein KatS3mg068_2600 [Candidatus Sericytochromatia bacterium]|nr:MAG: hypothetical protein KatS3mg068_2600 [Candidatus Sericytochromatia bacterium]
MINNVSYTNNTNIYNYTNLYNLQSPNTLFYSSYNQDNVNLSFYDNNLSQQKKTKFLGKC